MPQRRNRDEWTWRAAEDSTTVAWKRTLRRTGSIVARLAEILQPFRPGDKAIVVTYRNERVGGEVVLSEDWRVNLDDALVDRLCDWLAPENVQVLY